MTHRTARHILYGLAGADYGHLDRARILAREFARHAVSVDFAFDVRDIPHQIHGDALLDDRCELPVPDGRATTRRPWRIPPGWVQHRRRDPKPPRAEGYDLIISEMPCIARRSVRLYGLPTILLGNKFAQAQAPGAKPGLSARWRARVQDESAHVIGQHWQRFTDTVLPPLIDTSLEHRETLQGYTLVYLPGEDTVALLDLFKKLPREHFVVYGPDVREPHQLGHISLYPASRRQFRHHLQHASRILCNTNFETISQALHLGIPVLTQPTDEPGQQANAQVLRKLKLASVSHRLNILGLDRFVACGQRQPPMQYPDIAGPLVQHCLEGEPSKLPALSRRLWRNVRWTAAVCAPAA